MDEPIDFDAVARQLLRALRGARSQAAFSRRLGFRSNVAAKWESGQRMPTAAEAFRASRRAGIDVQEALRRFHPPTARILRELDRAHVAAWLLALRGAQTQLGLAKTSGLSRFSVARFLSGESQPRLPQFLALVHALSARLEDFVEAWVGVEHVPELRERHLRLCAAREAMFREPLCLAVMCLFDTRALDCDAPVQLQKLARTLGRTPRAIRRCIETLLTGGVLAFHGGRYRLTGSALTVDTTTDTARERAAREYWTRVALNRLRAPGASDVYSYNVFSITRADYQKLQQLQREFFRGARALIAASSPTEIAGLLVIHTMSWEPPA